MSDEITIDARSLTMWANAFADNFNISLANVLRYEMRLCLRDVIRWTPPQSLAKGREKVAGDFSRASRPAQQGLNMIRSRLVSNMKGQQSIDVGGMQVGTQDVFTFQMARANQLIAKKNYAGFNAMLQQLGGKLSQWMAIPFEPNTFYGAPRTSSGGIRVQRKFIFDLAKWRSMLRALQGHVGRLKAAWVPAYKANGGKDVPHWVGKHEAGARGSFVTINQGTDKITVIARNHALGVGRTKQIISWAVEARGEAMLKDYHVVLRDIKDKSQIQ